MKFKKGDKVKVIDDGQLYDTHPIGRDYSGWVYARKPKRRTKYSVIDIHMTGTETIYVIENASGQVYLYGEYGLELLSSSSPALSAAPEPFKFPDWVVIKPYDGPDKQGLVTDSRGYGGANAPACWFDNAKAGWSCNQSFRMRITPIEAATMLLALEEIHENSPC